jgi:CPA2 family monovalent cation:H+ antiporter-2
LGLTALLVLSKVLITGGLAYVFKRPVHQSIQLMFLLAQGSEFAFVILSMSTVQGAIGLAASEQLISAVALSMLLTPILYSLSFRLSIEVCRRMDSTICNAPSEPIPSGALKDSPVFIVGMNEIGKIIARAMRAHKIPYIAVDHNRKRFLEATASGYVVAFGQSNDLRFWNSLDVSRARAMCIASPRYEVAQKLTPVIKKLYPKLKRYAAVKDSADGVRYAALGVTPFHSQGTPPGLEMASYVLGELGVEEEKIQSWMEDEQAEYLETHHSLSDEQKDALSEEKNKDDNTPDDGPNAPPPDNAPDDKRPAAAA